MHHVTFTVIPKYSGEPFAIADSYVSDIYTSMVKHSITVITSFTGKSVRYYPSSGVYLTEDALVIQGTAEHIDTMSAVMQEFSKAPIIICVSSYED